MIKTTTTIEGISVPAEQDEYKLGHLDIVITCGSISMSYTIPVHVRTARKILFMDNVARAAVRKIGLKEEELGPDLKG